MDECFNFDALIYRLTKGLQKTNKQVVFLIGSALSAPQIEGAPGVPGVNGIISLIRDEFEGQQQAELESVLSQSDSPYQDAFHFLLGRRGPEVVGGIIKKAVGLARKKSLTESKTEYSVGLDTTDEACQGFDRDKTGWHLPRGVNAYGKLAAQYPDRFGRILLTTNFDPLVGASVSLAGGTHFRTVLHRDGNIGQTEGDGLHIVHLHGYWHGSDTLHTPRQLHQPRPNLKSSLAHLLSKKVVVVVGYGGWDDVFMRALTDVILDDGVYPEVIWTFREPVPEIRPKFREQLSAGLSRGRVQFYAGVDCNTFFPRLLEDWNLLEPCSSYVSSEVKQFTVDEIDTKHGPDTSTASILVRFDGEDDHPPVADFYVGRTEDIGVLAADGYSAAFLTGIGGQGKSALAAKYYADPSVMTKFRYRLWKDCRETSERFEDQVAKVVADLSGGLLESSEVAKQPVEEIATVFCSLTQDVPILIIFDNVDHYVDLENAKLAGAPGVFLGEFLKQKTKARLLFTCRPAIQSSNEKIISHRLEGLRLQEAEELFRLRQADIDLHKIADIHHRTAGHAFWLNLLAAQIAKGKILRESIDELLSTFDRGEPGNIDATLRSIWNNLPDREQTVLKALAESLRPISASELSDILAARIRFNQMSKAIKSLKGLNLVVIKLRDDEVEQLELHPLLRSFIKQEFPKAERVTFIDSILSFYFAFFGAHRGQLRGKPKRDTVLHWIEGAELYINAGKFDRALETLGEVSNIFNSYETPGEFIRVSELLFDSIDFLTSRSDKNFDSVFGIYVRLISRFGRTEKAQELLERYKDTIESKDARYIHYCDLIANLHWRQGNFEHAIKWASEGANLKSSSNVDTQYSSEHTLALAQRDSGAIDPALKFFLRGEAIEAVLNGDNLVNERGGEYYGNIGRCLHLMGQIEPALTCYKKSAKLIEDSDGHIENQAYVRQWIGELLDTSGDKGSAFRFLLAAQEKWKLVSPPKARLISEKLNSAFEEYLGRISAEKAESFCLSWIASDVGR